MLGGKFNLGSLMKNAKKIQEMMEQAQSEMAKIEVTGESGAGMAKVTMNAQNEVKNLEISEELLREDKTVIEELVAAAFNDASQKATKITQEHMMSASNLFGGGQDDSDDMKS